MKTVRNQSGPQPFYLDEHLFVDLLRELATLASQILALTRREYCLLVPLLQHAGEVVTRATLLRQVWGHVPDMRARTVNVHIGRLRRKLGM